MTNHSLRRHARLWLVQAAVAVALVIAAGLPLSSAPAYAEAAKPAAGAAAADDATLLKYLQTNPGDVRGRVSIPDAKSSLLIQPEGRAWRELRNGAVSILGYVLILGILAVLVVFYLARGRIRIEAGFSGRKIVRFDGLERFTHWLTATSFVILGLSGLNMLYGRRLLLPIMSPDSFAAMTHYGKLAHNFLSFAFVVGLLLMIVLWVHRNFPDRADMAWLKAGGGMFSRGKHPAATKFNAGQKILFWLVVLCGIVIAITGYILMFPFSVTDMAGMQSAQAVHAILALVMIAVIIAHIYIGTLGMEGAFDAMGTGEVDLNWAKEHHSLWLAEEQSRTSGAAAGAMPRAGAAE
ncbi:MAG TPA: formate dehydrogenase subunit gamma [Alphaproteobacteria bacterium]|nr:formate dehydrogenase subunit gamma [Alphaproteobacteria bacterium]